jgi:hypothetical protein
MSKLFTYKSAALLAVLSLTAALRSNAQETSTTSGAVFVMTNSNTGNEILQFARNPNGSLVPVGKTPTGGNGSGGTTDPLASQNSLLLTSDSRYLCRRQVEMSAFLPSRNVRFSKGRPRVHDSLISILRGVALPGKIQGRCDGAGSEVIGGKPSVNGALRGTLRGFCF